MEGEKGRGRERGKMGGGEREKGRDDGDWLQNRFLLIYEIGNKGLL